MGALARAGLPRTSTGKVRRKAVADWVAEKHRADFSAAFTNGVGKGARRDWLLTLIAQITGETTQETGDELRLSEDLHLDSLGRVQLAAGIEERLQMLPESGLLEEVVTLGELRRLVETKSEAAETQAPESATIPPTSMQQEDAPKTPPAFIDADDDQRPRTSGKLYLPALAMVASNSLAARCVP